MAKTREKMVRAGNRGIADGAGESVAVHGEAGPPVGWVTTAFLLGAFIYACIFFAEPAFRLPVWAYLLVPDDLVRFWVGGDISRFGIFDRIPVFLAAGAILGWAVAGGWLILRTLKFDRGLTRLEAFLFSAGAGLNGLASLCLLVGLAGQLRNRSLFAALAMMTCAAAWWQRPQANEFVQAENRPGSSTRWSYASILFVGCILLGSVLPPWYFDVREYHLQIPKEWFLQGRVDFVPHNVYGNMPLAAEMPAVLGMLLFPGEEGWWGGALVGKVVLGAYAPLTTLLLFAAGCRYFSRAAGGIAALIFASLPWTAHVSMSGMIEVALAFYFLLAVYAAWLSGGHPERNADPAEPSSEPTHPRSLACLTAAGFMAGAAAACKYPSVVFAVFPLAGWTLLRRFPKLDARGASVLVVAAAVAAGPWYAKNWYVSGNPTYPLLYSVFGGESWTPAKDRQWKSAHQVPPDATGHRYSLSALRDGLWLLGVKSDWLSPLLWPPAILGLVLFRRNLQVRWCVAVAAYLFVAWWLLTHRIDRFYVPSLPFLALVAGVGATWSQRRSWRFTFGTFLFVGLIYCFLIINSRFLGDTRYFVTLSDLRIDAPHPKDADYFHTHPTHHYLNHEVPRGYRVMLVGDAQPFDLNMPVLYNTCFDDCVLEKTMRGKSRAERQKSLREQRISHILVYWHELDRYRSPGNYGYSDYVTRKLVRGELVAAQGLLRRIPLDVEPENAELFEVVGWKSWTGTDGAAPIAEPGARKSKPDR